MKRYEGVITIKWYRNDGGGDRRPLTIFAENRIELKKQLKKIKDDFLEKGDIPGQTGKPGQLPYSVTFDMSKRI